MKKSSLSLCFIYGNEAAHIERFIRSFAPIASEICAVRAIGSQTPDESVCTISMVCEELKIPLRLGYYQNAPACAEWPHVDRFNDARNMAFGLATQDWVMWSDCDDILPEESSKVFNETLSNNPDADTLFTKYAMPHQDHELWRERIFKRASNPKWSNPVHESCDVQVTPKKYTLCEGMPIVHATIRKEMSGLDRNLKILKYFSENPEPGDYLPALWFYIHRDAYNRGDYKSHIEEIILYGDKCIKSDSQDLIQKYEVRINIATLLSENHMFVNDYYRITNNPKPEGIEDRALSFMVRHFLLTENIRWEPGRREAQAAMACLEMERGNYRRMLHWVNLMRGVEVPRPEPWTHQRAFYGWKGAMLYSMALRLNGRYGEAENVSLSVFESNKSMISVCHATRRGKQAEQAMLHWLHGAKNAGAIEWIFSVDIDDVETQNALKSYKMVIVTEPDKGPVAAWNKAAESSTGKILIQMSDDWDCPIHWDEQVLRHFGNRINKPGVLKISDGNRKDGLLTMAIMTRAYYDQYGYIFWPEFFSMYSDNELTERAINDDVLIDASNLVFLHNHPIFNPANQKDGRFDPECLDAVYKRSNADVNYIKGKQIFDRQIAKIKKVIL